MPPLLRRPGKSCVGVPEKKASAPLLKSGPSDEQTAAMMKTGAKVYKDACESCHQPQGEGVPRVYPPLANNPAITMRKGVMHPAAPSSW